MNFTVLKQSQDLDLSYKTDLDLWYCLGRKNLCLIIKEIRYYNLPGLSSTRRAILSEPKQHFMAHSPSYSPCIYPDMIKYCLIG